MTPSNFHTHSVFCDGRDTPEELVRKAVELGCPAIGFSGHSHTPFDEGYCMSPEGEKEYIGTVLSLKEKYEEKIRVYLGIEQDYYSAPPAYDYDFIIGSVHYVKKDGVYIPVDESPEKLEDGVKKYYGGDFLAFAEDYYGNVADLYNKTKCNIVGHFDIVAKFNGNGRFFDPECERYVRAAKGALEALFREDCAFEINTRGGRGGRTFPDGWIEAEIRKAKRKIVYSSDCHDREVLVAGIPEGYDNPSQIPGLKWKN